jgi:hypothetical protein
LVNSGDGECSEHAWDEELLEPLRQSTSPSGRTEGDRHVNPDLHVSEDKSNGSHGDVWESDEDELKLWAESAPQGWCSDFSAT